MFWWPGKNCYSCAGKFWFIHHIHQTLHLQMSISFGLYKILLMEEISIPWKTAKDTWNIKIKSFGKMEWWSCQESVRREWNKLVNTFFNKVLGENENVSLFFKNRRKLLANPINQLQIKKMSRSRNGKIEDKIGQRAICAKPEENSTLGD